MLPRDSSSFEIFHSLREGKISHPEPRFPKTQSSLRFRNTVRFPVGASILNLTLECSHGIPLPSKSSTRFAKAKFLTQSHGFQKRKAVCVFGIPFDSP